MPPTPKAVLASEGVAVDGLSTRVTLFNVVDVIFVQRLPALLQKIFVTVFYDLEAEASIFMERVRLIGPDGTVLSQSDVEIQLAARVPGQMPNGHRSIHALWGLKLTEAGDHSIVVEHRGAADQEWAESSRSIVTVGKAPYPFFVPLPERNEQSDAPSSAPQEAEG
jgi:hypothetical protein